MARGMQPARRTGDATTRVQSGYYATGQTYKKGAILVHNTNGELVEASADPTSIIGIALEGAGTKPGYDVANSSQLVVATGRVQETSYAVADREQEFSARAVNGGTDPVTPLQTHIAETYGVLKVANDWVIDMAEVTVKSIQITDIVEAQGGDPGFFLFKFLEAKLESP